MELVLAHPTMETLNACPVALGTHPLNASPGTACQRTLPERSCLAGRRRWASHCRCAHASGASCPTDNQALSVTFPSSLENLIRTDPMKRTRRLSTARTSMDTFQVGRETIAAWCRGDGSGRDGGCCSDAGALCQAVSPSSQDPKMEFMDQYTRYSAQICRFHRGLYFLMERRRCESLRKDTKTE